MKRIKKIAKIVLIAIALSVVFLLLAPTLFKGRILNMVKNTVNESVNAKFDFEDADLSLLKSFPNASVVLKKPTLINFTPFEGDTLFASEEIRLNLSITSLFKGQNAPVDIKALTVDNATLNILINEEGNTNYDIAKSAENSSEKETQKTQGFNLSLKKYEINGGIIRYDDQVSKIALEIEEFYHSGTGDLSLEQSELDTKTNALVSFQLDSTKYLNKNRVSLDALIGIDLTTNTYSFLKNSALVNQLPLTFHGFVKLNETNQEIAIDFETPSSDFKNFLAVIPEIYSKNINEVKTEGNFEVKGVFKGIVDETHIPTFTISMLSDDASFKYNELPKTVENIKIKTTVVNESGITNDTYIDIEKLSFRIDQDVFNLNARLTNLIENPYVKAHVDGKLNLGNLATAHPADILKGLKGILTANISSSFDMQSLENKRYENTQNEGVLNISDFEYSSEEISQPIQIKTAAVNFNPERVELNNFDAKIGETDLNTKGTIDNMLGFLFNGEEMKGDFILTSNTFNLNDFMSMDNENEKNEEKDSMQMQIKIPSFLNAKLTAAVNTVKYDNLELKNLKGDLIIKDQKASLQNVTSALFDGKLRLNGNVSTKTNTPSFAMDVAMDAFNLEKSFNGLQLFKALAPLASALNGTLNSTIKFSGNLNDNLTPDLNTVDGDLLAELIAASIKPERSQTLTTLNQNLNMINLKDLNLKDLKTSFRFENGKVALKPVQLNWNDITIDIDGNHTINNTLDYKATFNIPATYFGNDVAGYVAKLGEEDVKSINVPVVANFTGQLSKPSIKTDLKSAVTKLSKSLADKQKEKLINSGKDKAKNVLGNLLKNKEKDTITKDTTNNDIIKNTGKKLINNLFKKKKKEKDSTQN